jgi:small subunit ribosomal protein S17
MDKINNQPVTGTVVRVSSANTIRVAFKVTKVHPIYRKRYTLTKHFVAHDESNTAKVGDEVIIVMCRPISKSKHWTVLAK